MQRQRDGRGRKDPSRRDPRRKQEATSHNKRKEDDGHRRAYQKPRSTGPKCSTCGSLLTGLGIGIVGYALYLKATSSSSMGVVPKIESADSHFQAHDPATDSAIDVATGVAIDVASDTLSEGENLSVSADAETILLCATLPGAGGKCASLNKHWRSQTSQAEFFQNLPDTAKIFMAHYLTTKDDRLLSSEAKLRPMTVYFDETDWPRLMTKMSVTHGVTIVAS